MSLIKRVPFATDFSACADRAMGYALAMASAWKAELCVMTVLELYPGMDPDYTVNKMYLDHLRSEASRQLAAVEARAKAAGQPVTVRIETGIPSQAVQTVAHTIGADLLVVGTHGRTGLDHVLIGSTAERVVRMAPCPVLAVKAERGGVVVPALANIKRIVVPIDLSVCRWTRWNMPFSLPNRSECERPCCAVPRCAGPVRAPAGRRGRRGQSGGSERSSRSSFDGMGPPE